jgi:hypothetical protein
MRLWLAIGALALGCGSDELFALTTGNYTKTTLSITEDNCRLSMPIGATDPAYGELTVSPMQVTHTIRFTNEIFMRSGNALSRDRTSDEMQTGDCVLTYIVHEAGNATAADTIELDREETHRIQSGNCMGVVGSTCRSSFRYRLTRAP